MPLPVDATLRRLRLCTTCLLAGVQRAGRQYLNARLCDEHAPAQPQRLVDVEQLPRRELPPRQYGQATTDPLGRLDVDERTRLPKRVQR